MFLHIKEKVLPPWPYSPDGETRKMMFVAMAALVFMGTLQMLILLTG